MYYLDSGFDGSSLSPLFTAPLKDHEPTFSNDGPWMRSRKPENPFPGGRRAYLDAKNTISGVIESGVDRVPMDNGFALVVDRRPLDDEDNFIPSDEFTAYFSRGEVPVAEPGHGQFYHDIDHAPSYREMFKVRRFAELVRTAATNAKGDPALNQGFTGAIDGFGNHHNALMNEPMQQDVTTLTMSARFHLGQLIELAHPEWQDEVSTQQIGELFSQLGLAYYSEQAEAHSEEQQQFFDSF
ncbi:MAG TPA: hypothetical protein VK674_04385 [Candidatus Limnocylindria bacterium]|nr:hypothetical protein [Candidatus Limnocylindria bacterium]